MCLPKVIQIVVEPSNPDSFNSRLYALCEDGSIWMRAVGREGTDWEKINDSAQQD